MKDSRKEIVSWSLYDWANSSFATTVMAGFFPIFFSQYWSYGADSTQSTFFLGLGNSAASLVIAVIAPVIGAIADRGSYRKKLLILFAFIAPSLPDLGQVLVYAFYLVSVCTYALLPDFMYRGLEQMATITVRAVAIKFFATMMIFLFVHQPGDYYMVPLFTAIGNVGAIVFVYWHLFSKVGIHFCRVSWRQVWEELKESSQFFLSKVASSINSNLNGILLNSMAGATATGLYTNADKIIGAARSGMSPIADSLYPHMMKHRNFSLIKKAIEGGGAAAGNS